MRRSPPLPDNLVETEMRSPGNSGVPVVNKRISVTPNCSCRGAACKSSEDFVTLAQTLDKAAKEVGVNFHRRLQRYRGKGNDKGRRAG